jgi:hypothetical protein
MPDFFVEERYNIERHLEDLLVSSQDRGLGASACKTLHKSMAPENSEGENPDLKIHTEYFENYAKCHIFGEDTNKSKLNARRYYDHRNFENFLQLFGIAYFSFPF